MSNKKIIVSALVLAALILTAGLIWGRGKANPGPASGAPGAKQAPAFVEGADNAPVLIEEFTNLICPACGQFARETLPQIVEQYIKTGKVKFAFYVEPPLELSKAAYCASQQGKFIEFHDYIFSHQESITSEQNVFDAAATVGLDKTKFDACYNSKEAADAANSWVQQGNERGVTATPTFFINGEKVEGAKVLADFKTLIDSKIK